MLTFPKVKIPVLVIWLVSECFVNNAMATNATADVIFSLAVTAPVCRVANSKSTVQLPPASNPDLTLKDYLGSNGISIAGVNAVNRVTSPSLQVTTTVSCSSPATIMRILVAPAAGSDLWNSNWLAAQRLVDSSTPAVPFFAGLTMLEYEQVSVNGISKPWSYSDYAGNLSPYTQAFLADNQSGPDYIVNVTWRPTFYNGVPSAKVGKPVGGAFTGTARVTIDY